LDSERRRGILAREAHVKDSIGWIKSKLMEFEAKVGKDIVGQHLSRCDPVILAPLKFLL
jgi:hypothetical protein